MVCVIYYVDFVVCFVLQQWCAENATLALVTPAVFENGFPAISSLLFVVGRKE